MCPGDGATVRAGAEGCYGRDYEQYTTCLRCREREDCAEQWAERTWHQRHRVGVAILDWDRAVTIYEEQAAW